MNKNKKDFKLMHLIIIVVLTAVVSAITTGVILLNNKNVGRTIANSNDKDLQEFVDAYNSILEDYYEDIDKNKMLDAAIDGMLNYLGDDYTTYMDSNETDQLNDKLNGHYEGIGVEIREGNVVNKVFDNSPAKEAGIQAEDIIIRVNDEDVTTISTEDLATKIKTNKENDLKVTVRRGEEEIDFQVTKRKLYVPAIDSRVIDNNGKKTGYIYISTFSDTIYAQFNDALRKLEDEGIDNLIIDVRNDTGGYLSETTNIASLFLEKGKVIYSLENKKRKDTYKDETDEKRNYKVVVIINEASASASEILTAALKDSYDAILVGKKSFGKGKVQQTAKLKGGSMYKYTSAKWLRPNGDCIDKEGIKPDYEVDLEVTEDGTVVDTQLSKALEILGQ